MLDLSCDLPSSYADADADDVVEMTVCDDDDEGAPEDVLANVLVGVGLALLIVVELVLAVGFERAKFVQDIGGAVVVTVCAE
jgi:hypothetical protein